MARFAIILLLALSLVACGVAPVKLRTEVQEVYKPILHCPAPDWNELVRPELALEGLTSDMPAGEVVKRYKATVRQLQDYANRLEEALERYDATNDAYEELREQFTRQRELDGIADPTQ